MRLRDFLISAWLKSQNNAVSNLFCTKKSSQFWCVGQEIARSIVCVLREWLAAFHMV